MQKSLCYWHIAGWDFKDYLAFIYVFFCMCVYLCVPPIVCLYHVCSCFSQKTKDVGIPGTGVAGGSEPHVASSLKCRAISPVLNFKVP